MEDWVKETCSVNILMMCCVGHTPKDNFPTKNRVICTYLSNLSIIMAPGNHRNDLKKNPKENNFKKNVPLYHNYTVSHHFFQS